MTPPTKQTSVQTMETAARRSRSPLWKWVEAVPDAILLVRTDGAIAELNHNAELLFGYGRDELCGRDLSWLLPERFRERHAHHLTRYMADPRGRPMGQGMELWGLRKDGREFRLDIALSPWESPDGLYIICSIRDLSEHWLHHALEERVGFEKLVADISARFVGLPEEGVDQEIVRALQRIVEFMDVDRSSFFGFSGTDGLLTVTHSYALSGIAPVVSVNVDQLLPWYAARLRRGEVLRFERFPDDLPLEAEAERAFVVKEGIKASLTIPVKLEGTVAHVLSVGSYRSYRKWPEDYVQRLQLLGEIFASAIVRSRLQRALEEQLAFERLAADISARFANLQIEDVDAEITRSLQQIAEFLGVERNGLCEFFNEDGGLTATHYHAAPGIPPPPRILESEFPWYTSKLRRGGIHRYACLPDDLPPEAEREREYVLTVGMKAHLAIPIKVGGSVAYVLPVDSYKSPRPWPDSVVQRLQLLGEIFAGALASKRAHLATQESEAKFRLLAETATCAIGIYQGDRFRYINPRASDITGYSVEELLSLNVERLVHPDFRAQVLERAQARLRGEAVQARYELKILTKQGEERWVDFAATVAQYKGQPAIIGTAFDITERKQAEQYLQEVSGRLILAQEEERSRIARELHDDLSQRLALVTIGLEELSQRTAESAGRSDLQSLSDQTKEIAAEVHHLSRELHPSQLEMLGLVAAVQSFCTEVSRQKGLRVEFVHEGVPRTLPSEVRLCLYRVVQEALQNVCKHSRANQVRIELTGSPEALQLRIADQGVGFDPDSDTTQAGLGLISMRERVRLVNGRISVYSAPGQGTHVEVRVPLAPQPPA